eukprot:scaffold5783_cov129-Amphora_coffeaeformis.AAC.12
MVSAATEASREPFSGLQESPSFTVKITRVQDKEMEADIHTIFANYEAGIDKDDESSRYSATTVTTTCSGNDSQGSSHSNTRVSSKSRSRTKTLIPIDGRPPINLKDKNANDHPNSLDFTRSRSLPTKGRLTGPRQLSAHDDDDTQSVLSCEEQGSVGSRSIGSTQSKRRLKLSKLLPKAGSWRKHKKRPSMVNPSLDDSASCASRVSEYHVDIDDEMDALKSNGTIDFSSAKQQPKFRKILRKPSSERKHNQKHSLSNETIEIVQAFESSLADPVEEPARSEEHTDRPSSFASLRKIASVLRRSRSSRKQRTERTHLTSQSDEAKDPEASAHSEEANDFVQRTALADEPDISNKDTIETPHIIEIAPDLYSKRFFVAKQIKSVEQPRATQEELTQTTAPAQLDRENATEQTGETNPDLMPLEAIIEKKRAVIRKMIQHLRISMQKSRSATRNKKNPETRPSSQRIVEKICAEPSPTPKALYRATNLCEVMAPTPVAIESEADDKTSPVLPNAPIPAVRSVVSFPAMSFPTSDHTGDDRNPIKPSPSCDAIILSQTFSCQERPHFPKTACEPCDPKSSKKAGTLDTFVAALGSLFGGQTFRLLEPSTTESDESHVFPSSFMDCIDPTTPSVPSGLSEFSSLTGCHFTQSCTELKEVFTAILPRDTGVLVLEGEGSSKVLTACDDTLHEIGSQRKVELVPAPSKIVERFHSLPTGFSDGQCALCFENTVAESRRQCREEIPSAFGTEQRQVLSTDQEQSVIVTYNNRNEIEISSVNECNLPCGSGGTHFGNKEDYLKTAIGDGDRRLNNEENQESLIITIDDGDKRLDHEAEGYVPCASDYALCGGNDDSLIAAIKNGDLRFKDEADTGPALNMNNFIAQESDNRISSVLCDCVSSPADGLAIPGATTTSNALITRERYCRILPVPCDCACTQLAIPCISGIVSDLSQDEICLGYIVDRLCKQSSPTKHSAFTIEDRSIVDSRNLVLSGKHGMKLLLTNGRVPSKSSNAANAQEIISAVAMLPDPPSPVAKPPLPPSDLVQKPLSSSWLSRGSMHLRSILSDDSMTYGSLHSGHRAVSPFGAKSVTWKSDTRGPVREEYWNEAPALSKFSSFPKHGNVSSIGGGNPINRPESPSDAISLDGDGCVADCFGTTEADTWVNAIDSFPSLSSMSSTDEFTD